MLKNIRKISFILCFLLLFSLFPFTAYTEPKQSIIANLSTPGDLTVMFTYDAEKVDITFISPSGERLGAGSEGVEMKEGDLWRTYRIKGAAAGDWSVEYDLGSNKAINYSILRDNYGLWIQYFTLGELKEDGIDLSFQADFEGENVYYTYEIYAISSSDPENRNKIMDGMASANEATAVHANLSALPGGDYTLRLDVHYNDGEAEVFDSASTESFSYSNPNEKSEIADYMVKIDKHEHICTIDWSDFTDWSYQNYKLLVVADGETIYKGEFDNDVKDSSIVFSEGTKNLEIQLAYRSDSIWSKYKVKKIDLDKEYLSLKAEQITSSSQISLEYKVEKEREVKVSVNGKEGQYKVKDSGFLSFDLEDMGNEIYAEMGVEDSVFYIVDSSVYSDTIPPSITLFENLDGKTFFTNSVTIMGKMTGGNELSIAGKTVALDSSGNFSYVYSLSPGENVLEILAKDANGNAASRTLTLYRGGSILNKKTDAKSWKSFLPALLGAVCSLFVIILSVFFMKKRGKGERKRGGFLLQLILSDGIFAAGTVLCAWQFVERFRFANSLKYLDLVEKSASKAAEYLRWERIFGLCAIGSLILFLLCLAGTVLFLRKKKTVQ